MEKPENRIVVIWISIFIRLLANLVNGSEIPRSPNDNPSADEESATSLNFHFDVVYRIRKKTVNHEKIIGLCFQQDKAYAAAIALEDEVEITVTAIDMRDANNALRTHPMCITYIKSINIDDWTEYHRTETSSDLFNAKFVRKVVIPYSLPPGERPLKFELYSADGTSESSETSDPRNFLGFAESNLDELIEAGEMEFPLRNVNSELMRGRMIIHAEKLVPNNTKVLLQITGPKRWLGKSSSYLEIYKGTKTDGYVLAWRTEVIHESPHPKWSQMTIPLKKLCNGDYNRNLKFVCLDYEEDKAFDNFVGEFSTTLKEMEERFNIKRRTFRLVDPKKNSNAGNMDLIEFDVIKVDTFADLIKGGLKIHNTVAIDFTSANGDPRKPGTLHYRDPSGVLNVYEEAIILGVTVLENYDWDKKFPVYGFGARNPISGSICENFHISPNLPECVGVKGVLEAYRKHLSTMEFSWDTNFAPVIRIAVNTARTFQSLDDYYILLILTHGEISDFEETEEALAEASELPISIIIIGIGDSSFESMKKLANNTTDPETRRDIVQFVPYSTMSRFHLFNREEAVLFFAREFLAEVPDQVASHRMGCDGVETKSRTSPSSPL